MTILILCTFLPQIFVTLFAGVFADRCNRKWMIILADIFIAAVTLCLALFMVFGYTSWWLLFFISALRSMGSGVQTPCVSAILPQLVPESQLMRITGINTTISSISMLASPAVGGVLLGVWGLQGALFFDVITAFIGTSIFIFLKVPDYERITLQKDSNGAQSLWFSVIYDLREGLTYVKNHELIRKLLMFYGLFFFLVTPAAFLSPLLVERTFGNEVWMLTANEIAWSIGGVIGGIIISVWCGFKNKIFSMAISCLGFGICFALLGLASNLWVYLGFMLISGLFMPLYSTAETVLIQENVEEGMLGRVFSLISILITSIMPIGMILFGPLSDAFSIQSLMILTGVITIVLGIYMISNKKFLDLGKPKI